MTQPDPAENAAAVRAAAIAKAQLNRLVTASRRAAQSGRDPSRRPLVTIAVRSCNQGAFVADCISAIIDQDYDNIELIVIDDGSSDGSVAMIETMIWQCRARFARFEFRVRESRGPARTLNEAVYWARGTYFSLISADDVPHATKTSALVRELERETRGVYGVFAGASLIDEHGRRVGVREPAEGYYGFEDIVLRRHDILAPCQMLVLEKLKQVAPIPADVDVEDWYLLLSLTRRGGRLKVVSGTLLGDRQHETVASEPSARTLESHRRVLDYFADSAFYDVAVAQCCLAAALDDAGTSKHLAVQSLRTGLRHSKSILLSGAFLRLVGKLLVPNAALRALRRSRTAPPRRVTPA